MKQLKEILEQKDFVEFQKFLEQKLMENTKAHLEILQEIVLNDLMEAIPRRIIRVNSKGLRTKKKRCPKGFKLVDGNRCVPMTSKQKAEKKRSIRKAVRTKRADSSGKKKAIRKMKLARRKRKAQGL